jgi:transposase
MLVAMARKLAITLWRYVETGLVPEGVALAKTAAKGSAVM